MHGLRSIRRRAGGLLPVWALAFVMGPGAHLTGPGHTHADGLGAQPAAAPVFTLGPDDVFAVPAPPPAPAAEADHTHSGDDGSHLDVALLAPPRAPIPSLLPGSAHRPLPAGPAAGHRPAWWRGAPARGPPA